MKTNQPNIIKFLWIYITSIPFYTYIIGMVYIAMCFHFSSNYLMTPVLEHTDKNKEAFINLVFPQYTKYLIIFVSFFIMAIVSFIQSKKLDNLDLSGSLLELGGFLFILSICIILCAIDASNPCALSFISFVDDNGVRVDRSICMPINIDTGLQGLNQLFTASSQREIYISELSKIFWIIFGLCAVSFTTILFFIKRNISLNQNSCTPKNIERKFIINYIPYTAYITGEILIVFIALLSETIVITGFWYTFNSGELDEALLLYSNFYLKYYIAILFIAMMAVYSFMRLLKANLEATVNKKIKICAFFMFLGLAISICSFDFSKAPLTVMSIEGTYPNAENICLENRLTTGNDKKTVCLFTPYMMMELLKNAYDNPSGQEQSNSKSDVYKAYNKSVAYKIIAFFILNIGLLCFFVARRICFKLISQSLDPISNSPSTPYGDLNHKE